MKKQGKKGTYEIFFDNKFIPKLSDWWIYLEGNFSSILPITKEQIKIFEATPTEDIDTFFETLKKNFKKLH